jgi:hypothetical protein
MNTQPAQCKDSMVKRQLCPAFSLCRMLVHPPKKILNEGSAIHAPGKNVQRMRMALLARNFCRYYPVSGSSAKMREAERSVTISPNSVSIGQAR